MTQKEKVIDSKTLANMKPLPIWEGVILISAHLQRGYVEQIDVIIAQLIQYSDQVVFHVCSSCICVYLSNICIIEHLPVFLCRFLAKNLLISKIFYDNLQSDPFCRS